MPQNEYIDEAIKKHGRRLDHETRKRKKEARSVHKTSQVAQKLHGLKAKMFNKQRLKEKIEMKKQLKMHDERTNKHKTNDAPVAEGAIPTYLLDRENQSRAKVLSNMIKQKRKEKAGKWSVPLPKVKATEEAEVFKVIATGKRGKKQWKRMITKATFVGEGFTRKPPKYERFVRPMALRYKKAHVTHPELAATFCLPILGVKKNPNSPLYTQLGVLTKGTVIEVNVSELGMVTQSGKVVWGKYAQITNNPENDGSPTFFAEQATSENLPRGGEDIGHFLDIADKIKSKSVPAKDAIKAIKKRILNKNPNVSILALKLADVCVKNSGQLFLVEVATKDFMDTLYQLVKSNSGTNIDVRKKILELIQTWGIAFQGKHELIYVPQIYGVLKSEGYIFPEIDLRYASSVLIDTQAAPEWSDSDTCTRCKVAFTSFNRKHHCRNCGRTFCQTCSSKTRALPHLGIENAVRVCDWCDSKFENKVLDNDPLRAPSSIQINSDSDMGRQAPIDNAYLSKEEQDFERAIAESLQLAQFNNVSKPIQRHAAKEESDDEDIEAAIKASLKETRRMESKEANSHQQIQRATLSLHNNIQYGDPQTALPDTFNPYEVSIIERENIRLFSQLIANVERELHQNGPSRINFQQLNASYQQVLQTQPRMTRELNQSIKRYHEFQALQMKIAEASRVYEEYLSGRIDVQAQPHIYGRTQTTGTGSYSQAVELPAMHALNIYQDGTQRVMYPVINHPQHPTHVYQGQPEFMNQQSQYVSQIPIHAQTGSISEHSLPTQRVVPQYDQPAVDFSRQQQQNYQQQAVPTQSISTQYYHATPEFMLQQQSNIYQSSPAFPTTSAQSSTLDVQPQQNTYTADLYQIKPPVTESTPPIIQTQPVIFPSVPNTALPYVHTGGSLTPNAPSHPDLPQPKHEEMPLIDL